MVVQTRRFDPDQDGHPVRMTLLFRPVGIISGLIAGFIASKIFEKSWSSISNEEPPAADQRAPGIPKLIVALLLEGAVFSLVRGLVDHGARVAFKRYTGAWPGDDDK